MPREDVGAWDGHLLRALRAEAAMSQAELAERLGIQQSTLSRWEKNYTAPPPYAMDAIREALASARPRPPYIFAGAVLLGVTEGVGHVVQREMDGLGRTFTIVAATGPMVYYDGRLPEAERRPLTAHEAAEVPPLSRIPRRIPGTPEETAAAAAALRPLVGVISASRWSTDSFVVATRPVQGGRWKVTLGVGGTTTALPATHATPEDAEAVARREIGLRRAASEDRYRALLAGHGVEARIEWPELRSVRPEDGTTAWDALP